MSKLELARPLFLLLMLVAGVVPACARPQQPVPHASRDYEVMNDRSAAHNARGEFEAALEAADRALALNTSYSYAWNNKAVALIGLGRHEEALEAADRALEADPRNAIAWTNKALVHRRTDRPEEAVKAIEQAVLIDDRNPLIWYNKACYHAIYNDRPNALKSLSRALTLEPKLKKLAAKESDFDSLKEDPEFKKLVVK